MPETLGSIKSRIARVAGLCSTDQRVTDLINEATQRLITRGRWRGLVARYNFCLSQGCFSAPREIETILSANISNVPVHVENGWYEFVDNGPGYLDSEKSTIGYVVVDRGLAPTFHDICGERTLRVYADLPEDAGAQILIKGFDENSNPVTTLVGGSYVDGEYIDIDNATPQNSTKTYTAVTGVQKPVTNGIIRLYEVNAATGVQSLIGLYHPDETIGEFRRYYLDHASTDADNPTCVRVRAKRRYIPVSADTDRLLIENFGALKFMILAIEKEERNLYDDAAKYESKAIRILGDEWKNYQGETTLGHLNIQFKEFGMGDITNMM